jgi:hypothetical protein
MNVCYPPTGKHQSSHTMQNDCEINSNITGINFKTQVQISLKFIIWPCCLLESKRKQDHNKFKSMLYHAASFNTA